MAVPGADGAAEGLCFPCATRGRRRERGGPLSCTPGLGMGNVRKTWLIIFSACRGSHRVRAPSMPHPLRAGQRPQAAGTWMESSGVYVEITRMLGEHDALVSPPRDAYLISLGVGVSPSAPGGRAPQRRPRATALSSEVSGMQGRALGPLLGNT